MVNKVIKLNPALYNYLLSVSLREPHILAQLRQDTHNDMQIAPDQGQFMALLIQLMGAKKIIEIGTFTGYSALWMALALPPDGTLITCDIENRCREFGPNYWRSEEHTSELQSLTNLVCRLLLEKKKQKQNLSSWNL